MLETHHLVEINPGNALAIVAVRSPFTGEREIHTPWLHEGVFYIPASGTVLIEERRENGTALAVTLHLYGSHLPTRSISDPLGAP